MFFPKNDITSRQSCIDSLQQYISRTDDARPSVRLNKKDTMILAQVRDMYMQVHSYDAPIEWFVELFHEHSRLFLWPCENCIRRSYIRLLYELRGYEVESSRPRAPQLPYRILPPDGVERPPSVYWLWGPTGTGKSYTAFKTLPRAWSILGRDDRFRYDADHPTEDVIVDNVYPDTFSYHEFLGLLHNCTKPRHVIITSIQHPRECFKHLGAAELALLLRHITWIVELQLEGKAAQILTAVNPIDAGSERTYQHVEAQISKCALLSEHLAKLAPVLHVRHENGEHIEIPGLSLHD